MGRTTLAVVGLGLRARFLFGPCRGTIHDALNFRRTFFSLDTWNFLSGMGLTKKMMVRIELGYISQARIGSRPIRVWA